MAKWKSKTAGYDGHSKTEKSFLKLYSEEELSLLKALDVEQLKLTVATTSAHVMKAKRDLERSPEYQQAKSNIQDLSSGLRETKKYADVKRAVCLAVLQEKGIVDCGEDNSAE